MNRDQNLSIKHWADEDKPREKLIKKGLYALSNAELIALLISTGTKKLSAVDVAKLVLADSNNNLNQLGKRTLNDLIKNEGIGQAKAISIIAALELGRRRKNADMLKVKITDSTKAFEIIQPLLGDLPHEEFWTLYLNRANEVIDNKLISRGGTTGTVIDTKIILKAGIEKLANGIILAHNHPSGNIKPSKNDIQITTKIKEAAKLIDITVLDHIIIGNNKFYSFADEGSI